MKLTEKEIRELLKRWYEARTTVVEECILREWFRAADTLPQDLEAERRMFCGFATLSDERAPQLQPVGESSRDRRRGLIRRIVVWTAAAVVAVGVVAAAQYARRPYGYIDGVPVRDAETAMQATVYFQQLEMLDQTMNEFDKMMKQTQNEKL